MPIARRWPRKPILFWYVDLSVTTRGAAIVFVLFALVLGVGGASAQASLLYPDLKTLPPRDLRFDRTDVTAESLGILHNVLRFSNTVYNAGEGPLEIRAKINQSLNPPSGQAYQRVYETGGGYKEFELTGATIYYHAVHKHYHFDHWGAYQLWTKAGYESWISSGRTHGEPYLIGQKTTSCVEDEEFVASVPAAVWPAVYVPEDCGTNAENEIAEGLSPGWGDTYDWYRFEQWIDLGESGTLANGTYVLRSVVDPDNIVYESPEKSDSSREGAQANEATTTFKVSDGTIEDGDSPTGTVTIDHVDESTSSPQVTLEVLGRDDLNAVDQVRVSNDGATWKTYANTSYDSIAQTIAWNLADPAYGGSEQAGQRAVYVQFHDPSGWGPTEQDTIEYTPPQGGAPAAPSALAASASSATQIELSWSENASVETGEVLQRSTDPAFSEPVSIPLAAGTHAYADTGLSPATTYWYRVQAISGAQSSPYSNAAQASTVDPASYRAAVLADRPLSYWRLDETSGSVAGDQRVANPGTYVGATTLGAPGLIPGETANTAVGFDGHSGDVRIGQAGALDFSTAMTLEAWISPTSLPSPGSSRSILAKPGSYALQLNGSAAAFTVVEFGVRNTVSSPQGSIAAGGSYQVVGTYDGVDERLYVNGVQVAIAPLAGSPEQSLGGMHIGSWDGSTEFFAGTIDEAAVYSAVLSADRIADHHEVSGAPSEPPPSEPPPSEPPPSEPPPSEPPPSEPPPSEPPPSGEPPPTQSSVGGSSTHIAPDTSGSSSGPSGSAGAVAHAAVQFPCSGRDGAKKPCRFSTPGGDIRCLWTPSPNALVCDLVASGRAYRLQPRGRSRAIKLKLARAGQTLATGRQIVFPQSLSCRDTRTTMTCNQDFGTGAFTLAPKGSHGS